MAQPVAGSQATISSNATVVLGFNLPEADFFSEEIARAKSAVVANAAIALKRQGNWILLRTGRITQIGKLNSVIIKMATAATANQNAFIRLVAFSGLPRVIMNAQYAMPAKSTIVNRTKSFSFSHREKFLKNSQF